MSDIKGPFQRVPFASPGQAAINEAAWAEALESLDTTSSWSVAQWMWAYEKYLRKLSTGELDRERFRVANEAKKTSITWPLRRALREWENRKEDLASFRERNSRYGILARGGLDLPGDE